MDFKKVSLILVGLIWLSVGIGLSIVGANWIYGLGLGPKMIIFFSASVLVGSLKGKFVLQKVAMKYYKRADLLQFNNMLSLFFGWAQILGVKGFFLIGLMMVLGGTLRRSPIDRPILGIIYLAVGIALVYASKIFFKDKLITAN